MRTKIAKITKGDEPPETLQQLSQIPYPAYKELTNFELAYMTYYEVTQVIQKNHNRHCPTCQNTFNSLTRLTIHRKNTKTCTNDDWVTKITMETCGNRNCGALLANTTELEKHKSYRCGISNPYLIKHEALKQRIAGGINRRTIAGWGIPKNDITTWNGKIRYSEKENNWKCTICGYTVGPWGRTRIAGHVASTHGYTARLPNERWNIPQAEQRNKTNKDTHKKNKRTAALG